MSHIELTDQNFEEEVLNAEGVVLVDFWAPWCGPCKMLTPIMEQVEEEIGDKAKIGKLNVDENPETAGKYKVMSIPTVKVFKDGEEVESLVGLQTKEVYVGLLVKHAETD